MATTVFRPMARPLILIRLPARLGWPCGRSKATVARCKKFPGASRARQAGRNIHAQIASDHRPACTRRRAALDRPRHRRDRLAADELYDQSDPMGGIWRPSGRAWSRADLAGHVLTTLIAR